MNTTSPIVQEASNAGEVVILLLLALCMLVVGMSMGVAACRLPNATRRVMLRALEHYESANGDPTVQTICRRQIRRLQSSLGIDDDEA